MIERQNVNFGLADIRYAKRPYSAPTLLVFGQVAALTRSGSGNCMSDGSSICGGSNTMSAMA